MNAKRARSVEQEGCLVPMVHLARVRRARRQALEPDEQESLAGFFKALGDPTRLRLLWALAEGEMCVCDLAAFLDVSSSAVSHQLRRLRDLRLVKNRRQGPLLYYSLDDRHVEQIIRVGLDHLRH